MYDVLTNGGLMEHCTYYAYDAYYLETACRLHLPLLTLDVPMQKIAINLNLKILGEQDENI